MRIRCDVTNRQRILAVLSFHRQTDGQTKANPEGLSLIPRGSLQNRHPNDPTADCRDNRTKTTKGGEEQQRQQVTFKEYSVRVYLFLSPSFTHTQTSGFVHVQESVIVREACAYLQTNTHTQTDRLILCLSLSLSLLESLSLSVCFSSVITDHDEGKRQRNQSAKGIGRDRCIIIIIIGV